MAKNNSRTSKNSRSDSNNGKDEQRVYRIIFSRKEYWSVEIPGPNKSVVRSKLWNDNYDKSTERWLSGSDTVKEYKEKTGKDFRQEYHIESVEDITDK